MDDRGSFRGWQIIPLPTCLSLSALLLCAPFPPSKTARDVGQVEEGQYVKFHPAGTACLLALCVFGFEATTYGLTFAGLYVLKRASGFDLVKGVDMVPDEAVEHALSIMAHWAFAAVRMAGLG